MTERDFNLWRLSSRVQMMNLVISLVFHEKMLQEMSDRFIINTFLFALDYLSLIKYLNTIIQTEEKHASVLWL